MSSKTLERAGHSCKSFPNQAPDLGSAKVVKLAGPDPNSTDDSFVCWMRLASSGRIADFARMKKRIVPLVTGFAVLIALAACETTPPPPTEMDQATYAETMRRADANPSAVAVDRDLSALLARSDLSEDQQARIHLIRARKRWRGGYNKPGAVADFKAFLRLLPLDPEAARVRVEQGHVRTEIRQHEQRLVGLQTLPNWFDDKLAMGALDEAAARYRKSGLTPTDNQVYVLREAGFICADGAGGSGGEPVHQHGTRPAYAANLVWCPMPANS